MDNFKPLFWAVTGPVLLTLIWMLCSTDKTRIPAYTLGAIALNSLCLTIIYQYRSFRIYRAD